MFYRILICGEQLFLADSCYRAASPISVIEAESISSSGFLTDEQLKRTLHPEIAKALLQKGHTVIRYGIRIKSVSLRHNQLVQVQQGTLSN